MSVAHLYCQGRCATSCTLRYTLAEHGVDVETHDVTTGPRAYATVIALDYRSVAVLVGPDGTAAAGSRAGALARRLTSSAGAPVDTTGGRVHSPRSTAMPDPGAKTQMLANHDDEVRRTWHLASGGSHPRTAITATRRAAITAPSRTDRS